MSRPVLATRPTPQPRAAERFRPEIQALRALAVLSVLLFHLWPGRLTGGFVGVDVFFVISGYLITSHLLREVEQTGRVRVATFWARRAKRLLPGALLVLLVTALATLAWAPRTVWPSFFSEIAASTLYVENWLLAANSVDYLAADNPASPVQHFWTLSVEEQFYVALPLLILLVLLPRAARARRAVLLAIGVVSVASLVYSVWYTAWAPQPAYFSTLTRAWEFGTGALVVALPRLARPLARQLVVLAGVAAIAAAVLLFDASTPFPSASALLPVLGTAAVIWAGTGTVVERAGRWAPVALVGRISYAVYLWHWPPIVLVPLITGQALTTPVKLVILAGSIAVAWLTTVQWEDRVRFSPRLLGRARPRTVAAVSAGGMALVLLVSFGALAVDRAQTAAAAAEQERLVTELPDCLGAASMADAGCRNPDLDGVLIPDPAAAPEDDGNRSECWSGGSSGDLRICSLGPESGYERHILAVGDSHNNSLVGAYEQIARERNWRIDVAGRGGCYWTTLDLEQSTTELRDACARWRAAVAAHVAEATDLDAILVTKSRRPLGAEVPGDDAAQAFDALVSGMADAWLARGSDVPVIALTDNPRLPDDTPECVARNGLDVQVCAAPRAQALPPDGIAEAVSRVPGASLVDLTDLYCDAQVCPAVIGHVVVYQDGWHLTDTYARTVAPYLGSEIARLLDASAAAAQPTG